MTSNNNSGQDAEEAAELMATMRAEHVPMKSWYNNNHPGLTDLKSKYGDFPLFWQDLIKWDGWKEVRRAYLRFTETGSYGSSTTAGGPQDSSEDGRKRSRWSKEDENPNSSSSGAPASATDAPPQRKRKSRWGRGRDETPKPVNGAPTIPGAIPGALPANDPVMAALGLGGAAPAIGGIGSTPSVPGDVTAALSVGLPPEQQAELTSLQSRLRLANSRLTNLESEAARIDALPRNHPDRSPSPPPVYGPDGTRKNTRANRWKERYTEERHTCLERIMELLPNMKPPPGFIKRKRSRKIKIPVDEHPTYNFIGLIIGPRGKTQKDMENKTGCKIAIRGKGSIKEGAKGRMMKQPMEGDDEPLHVVITGDDPRAIDAAAEMIESMLVVIDDEKNVHKQNQLRELALLNGTLKEEEWCHLCGEKGHRNFECPKRFALNKSNVVVKCAICGDTSHPTRDCALNKDRVGGAAGADGAGDTVNKEKQLDSDYTAFMAELDGKPVPTGDSGAGGEGGAPAAGGVDLSSVLTIIQPARKVKLGENGEPEETPAPAAGTSNGNSLVTTISPITTISTTVTPAVSTGVTTISSTVPGVTTISSGVTTISSTVGTTGAALPPAPTSLPPPPPGAPPASLGATTTSETGVAVPPLPAGIPPAPAATGGVAGTTTTDASAATATGVAIPPPPPGVPNAGATALPPPPPPPPPAAAAGAYPNQMYPTAYGGYQYPAGYPQQAAGAVGYGQYPQQSQQAHQQQWGAAYGTAAGYGGAYGAAPAGQGETAGWDPRSYYGTDTTGDAGGAGGFNWWDQSS